MAHDPNATEAVPTITPMFPLQTVLFPGSPLPLRVFEPRYQQLIADTMTANRCFGVVLIARGSEVGGGDERLSFGTLAEIEALSPVGDGQFALLARGTKRLRVANWLEDEPYPRAEVELLGDDLSPAEPSEVEEAFRHIRTVRALLSELHDTPPLPPDLELPTDGREEIESAIWTLCSLAPFDTFDRQRLLESSTLHDRVELLIRLCGELAQDLTTLLAQGSPEFGEPEL